MLSPSIPFLPFGKERIGNLLGKGGEGRGPRRFGKEEREKEGQGMEGNVEESMYKKYICCTISRIGKYKAITLLATGISSLLFIL